MQSHVSQIILLFIAGLLPSSCFLFSSNGTKVESIEKQTLHKTKEGIGAELQLATFAGGCFWCMEPPFEELDGVMQVISGYSGGTVENPDYKSVTEGGTGHVEAVQITFDPKKVSYTRLLQVYFRNIDPTDFGGQFVDQGDSYRPVIFYHTEEQQGLAEKEKKSLSEAGIFTSAIVVPIEKYKNFYPAEDYHQDYYKKNSIKYKYYRYRSGRDQFLETYWGKKP